MLESYIPAKILYICSCESPKFKWLEQKSLETAIVKFKLFLSMEFINFLKLTDTMSIFMYTSFPKIIVTRKIRLNSVKKALFRAIMGDQ